MRLPEDSNPSVIIQKFQSEDGEPLGTLRTLICDETGESYVLWKDIQEAFVGIGHLNDWSYGFALRVLFMADKTGELYVIVDNWVRYLDVLLTFFLFVCLIRAHSFAEQVSSIAH